MNSASTRASRTLVLQRSLDDELAGLPFPDRADPVGFEQAVSSFEWAVNTSRRAGVLDDALARRKIDGVLVRLVSRPAHETVMGNAGRDGTAFARVPEPGACSFCLMLASRGAVYASRGHALRVGTGGVRKGTKQAEGAGFHDHCRCLAIEVKRDGSDLPRINKDLEQLWDESGSTSQADFRKALDTRAEQARGKKKSELPIGKYSAGEQTRRWKDLASTPRLESAEGLDAYLRANPNFGVRPAKLPVGMHEEPWKVNCVRCVSASELRRRGYDVTAGPGSFNVPVGSGKWNAQHALDIGWRNRETGKPPRFMTMPGETKKADRDLVKYLNRSMPDGSRGFVTNSWYTDEAVLAKKIGLPMPENSIGSGHILMWEKRGNRIVFHDPQVGETKLSSSRYMEHPRFVPGSLAATRIDDCDPVDGVLDVIGGELNQWR